MGTSKDKYGLSQSDFYQMAAYGERYLEGAGDMFLIYPRSPRFSQHLTPFELSPDLRLWVVPFDLESDEIGLPEASSFGITHGIKYHKIPADHEAANGSLIT